MTPATCPRCDAALRPPGLMASGWRCPDHGEVQPLRRWTRLTPEAKVEAAGHDTPLWRAPSAQDRVAFVGEASGVWLHAVLWPPAAELVLLEHVELHDLRHAAHAGQVLPLGAPTVRLGGTHA
jgi:hypothetical protein